MRAAGAALAIVSFWRAAGPAHWFATSERFDRLVRMRLGRAQVAAAGGALDDWLEAPENALALVLLLDQAPRNLFRNTSRAFATDAIAAACADAAVAQGFDRRFPGELRQFFYLPFEHSEDIALQRKAIALFAKMGDAEALRWARIHADVIERFGRFPHRNAILGRRSSAEEKAFLEKGGFAG